jgi:hypothetical protein
MVVMALFSVWIKNRRVSALEYQVGAKAQNGGY